MKRSVYAVFAVIMLVALAAVAFAGAKAKMELKAGEEIFACNCGEKCPCNTMSRNAGNCTCGKEMVKAKVTKLEGDAAYIQADGWEKERPFRTTAKYACACGPTCKCGTISQNPGKCTCGVEMEKTN